jgi:flagellar P-ring protein FlgI
MHFFLVICLLAGAGAAHCAEVRLKDLGKFSGWRENALVGYGLVTGLAGTGDSNGNKATRQAIANMLANFDVALAPDQVRSRNAAAVMVSASLPPFASEGDAVDVTVMSLADARSLTGGVLLMTPLKASDGRVYALAQGALSVGGYKYDFNGNVVQKNHPTVGGIPGGATVEVAPPQGIVTRDGVLTYLLDQADSTTAERIAAAVNKTVGREIARSRSAGAVEIRVPGERLADVTRFIASIENTSVTADQRARVVIDERTGTVVAGGSVQIDKVVIAHGDLKISINTEYSVSQPSLVVQPGPSTRTAVVANSTINASEPVAIFVPPAHNTVADLVRALAGLKTSTRDVISILRAVKAAGALHADLVIL